MKGNPRGFTFIEMLVTVAVYSIVALCLYSAFRAGVALWKGGDDQIERNETSRLLSSIFSRDLRNAVNFNSEKLPFKGEASYLSFMTLAGRGGSSAELARVTYEINGDKGILTRRIAYRKDGFDEKAVPAVELARGVKNLAFSFAYEKEESADEYAWLDKWKDGEKQIPRGVRLALADGEKTVFVPMGVLGGENAE